MGVRKTTDFLEKATWVLAGFVVVACITASVFLPHNQVSTESGIKDEILNSVPAVDPNTVSPFATPVPAEDETPVE
jgi:preprotein translocase subunit SecG